MNKKRAQALLAEARLHAAQGAWAQVRVALEPVLEARLADAATCGLAGEALRQLGRRAEARALLESGLAAHPHDAELEARLGCVLLELDDVPGAVEVLGRATRRRPRDPQALTAYASALVRGGRFAEAEQVLARALLAGGGLDTKLVLASAKVRRGALAEAELLTGQVEDQSREPALSWAARSLRALIRLLRGDAAGALEAWTAVEAAGFLDPGQLAHVAYAAQLAGDRARADAVIERRLADGADAEDLLLFAQIDNQRGEPGRALERLERAAALGASGFELLAARGRTLRLLGRPEEARAALMEAAACPEASLPVFGAPVAVDLGHLSAEAGDFEAAERHFERALALDPDDPEARRALELTRRRLAWRTALEASAEERVEAARAEAEALRRRFLSRELEVETLRRELARLQAERAGAQALASQAERERAQRAAEEKARVREALEQQERDIEAKAAENLDLAFSGVRGRCPEVLFSLLQVAERTYQKALYTELPAAAVAVLYSGAFERSLVELLVRPFDAWLDEQHGRAEFLEGGVRERRGNRVEYFDRFFECLDREQSARPPSLGEMSRVLERRHERYLAPFARFLSERVGLEDAFWDEFAGFVTWAKETLRDPVAHGHLELDWDGLKRFRERLLFSFAGQKPGALPRLLGARGA
jgi:tetratricopeptide (TPR) repeat protein